MEHYHKEYKPLLAQNIFTHIIIKLHPMPKISFILPAITILFLAQSFIHSPGENKVEKNVVAINGKAPSLTARDGKIYMAFASSDSIFYCLSADKGKSFSVPLLAVVLPKLGIGGGRGPQIISIKDQLLIAASDNAGNIFTFTKKKNAGSWQKGGKINDVPEIAKEGFVSLAANNNGEVYAIWLDLRGDKKNKIVGAKSGDGGRTWSKNKIIYKSPDSTVCECCKPSVAMKGQMVVVMFRNWLNGNRDLHVIQSNDGGINFGKAQKSGEGSWKLNGCPMDGGGLVINSDNTIHTVWRRQGTIYSCEAGKKEEMVATGKQCVITGTDANTFIAFMNDGKVYGRRPDGKQVELGSGGNPRLIATDTGSALCAWENDGKVNYASLSK